MVEKTFVCELCDKLYTTKGNLKLHIKIVHHGEKLLFPCSVATCEEKLSTRALRQEHLHKIHNIAREIFSCTHCDVHFLNKSSLKDHINFTHQGVQFKCELCQKRFANLSNLTYHTKTHISIEDRKEQWNRFCDLCCEVFEYKSQLEYHMNLKHRLLRLHCSVPQCEASFSTQKMINRHIKTVHSENRPFSCDKCLSTFKSKSALTQHNNAHATDKAFHCSQCSSAFVSQDRLNQHMQMHNPVDFVCPEPSCGMVFRWRGGLYNHKKVHTEVGQMKRKKKEQHFAEFLEANQIQFKREHHIDLTCVTDKKSFFRIDFLIQEKGRIFMIELDEDAHQHYSIHCDTTRPFRIHETLTLEGNTLPIVIIRFNPDVCKVDGEPKRIYKIDRYKKILNLLQEWDSDAPLSVVYCYYPIEDGKLMIEAQEDFNPHLRDIMTIMPL